MTRLLLLLLLAVLQPAAASTLVVRSTADTAGSSCGASCTLRQAITVANGTAAADEIFFSIPGDGPLAITPASSLPTITQPLTIDGYSQPGALPNTLASTAGSHASNAVIRVWLHPSDSSPTAPPIGLPVCASNVTIRGLAITGFGGRSIAFGQSDTLASCTGATNGVVAGNFLGLDPMGSIPAAQDSSVLIHLQASATVRIGGSAEADSNVMVGSIRPIQVSDGASAQIDGNLIGTDPVGTPTGTTDPDAKAILVGTTGTAAIGTQRPNLLVATGTGISVLNSANRVSIGPNRFVGAGLPVDLGDYGVTPNDLNDVDSGPNGLQNFPVLSLARRGADSLLVQGTVDRPTGTAALTYTIALFASTGCIVSGHGPGQRLLGSQSITLANGSSQTFSITLNGIEPLAVGTSITAMATDSNGNSSEMSTCLPVTEHPAALVVSNTLNSGPGSLVDAVAQANANADASIIAFNIPGAGPHTIATSAPLLIQTPMLIDGYTQPGAARNTLTDGATNAQVRIVIDAVNIGSSISKFFATAPLTLRGIAIMELGNGSTGVNLTSGSNGSRVQGCFIGTDALGGVTGAATGTGIVVNAGSQVGGTLPEHRNLFGGLQSGVGLFLSGGNGSVVEGNLFGTAPDGLAVRSNECSLRISAASAAVTGTRLGGLLPAEQNHIANDTGICGGVSLTQTSGTVTGVVIGNTVHSSNTIGIDLGADRVTLNDVHDFDAGPNDLQNFPELFLAQPVAGLGLRVTGRLDIPTVTLDLRYRLAFYESAACDPSGHGEGTLYLGSRDVELSDQPSPAVPAERFVVDLPVSSAVGSIITATATAPNGSTSEFSKCIAVASADTLARNGFE